MNDIRRKLCKILDMPVGVLLNVRVTRTKKFIQLDQSVYIHKVLDKFADFIGLPHKTRKC